MSDVLKALGRDINLSCAVHKFLPHLCGLRYAGTKLGDKPPLKIGVLCQKMQKLDVFLNKLW
jgi:hypothetical protein